MYKVLFSLILAICLFSCEKNKTTTFEYRIDGTEEVAIAYSTLDNPVVRDTIIPPWSYTIQLEEGQCHNFQLFVSYVYFDNELRQPLVHSQPWIVLRYDDQLVGSVDGFGMCLDTDCEYQEKALVISQEICR